MGAERVTLAPNLQRFFDAILLVFALGTFFLAGIVCFNSDKYLWSSSSVALLLGLPLVLGIGALASLRSRPEVRVNIAFCLVFIGIALGLAELIIPSAIRYIGTLKGLDLRTKLDVTVELRAKGVQAFPSIHPINLFANPLRIENDSVIPLAGISDVTTVFCNELGEYYIYQSDEFGFNNPLGSWSQPKANLALLGDSFAHGACATQGRSFAELLRSHFGSTINAGIQGDGPLLELAKLRELLAPRQPNLVLWFYFEGNDIEDLSTEMRQAIIGRYLADINFSQRIVERKDQIDTELRHYVETQMQLQMNQSWFQRLKNSWAQLRTHLAEAVRLWNVRQLIGLINFKRGWIFPNFNQDVTEREVEDAFQAVMSEAKQIVSAYGGDLIFVYLPAYENFSSHIKGIPHPWRERVLRILSNQSIPVIDLLPIFQTQPDPLDLYPFRGNGHFSIAGNQLAAREIIKFMEQHRSYIPRKVALNK